MKAIRYHKFGSPEVLRIEAVDDLIIHDNQMLVAVYATTINSGDCHLRSGTPFLARIFAGPIVPRQKILGTTYSGKVVQIGANISNFKVGDEVLGSLGIKSGAHAEYVAVAEDAIVIKKPTDLTHEEAASMVFGSLSAKYFLDKAGVRSNKSVLVIGAAGAVGSYAVQYANSLGANITGVCHKESADFVSKLGAKEIIDYTTEELINHKMGFDIIFDTVGKESLSVIKACLAKEGTYITTVARLDVIMRQFFNKDRGKQFVFDVVKSDASSLAHIMQLFSAGLSDVGYSPLMDSIYKMDEVVKAHHHVETSRKKGAVVLNIKG